MIPVRQAPKELVKLLILFSTPSEGEVRKNKMEIAQLTGDLHKSGVDLGYVSWCCLCDDPTGKSSSFKAKETYIKEVVDTYAPNLIVLADSKAHEVYTGLKGASKFYGRVWTTDNSNQKLLTMPAISACKYNPALSEVIKKSVKLIQNEMESKDFVEVPETVTTNYVLVDTIEKYREWHRLYQTVPSFALDIETTSLQFNNGRIITIQFSEGPGKGWCIPAKGYTVDWTDAEWTEIITGIQRIVEDDSKEKILANAYFDLKYLSHAYGFKLLKHNVVDVLIHSFLCDENRESHSLKFCAATLLKTAGDYDRELSTWVESYCKANKILRSAFTYDLVPAEVLFKYGCMDVDYTFQLREYFRPLLEKEEQVQVSADVHRYAWALARIEMTGWALDLPALQQYAEELEQRIPALKTELAELPHIKKTVQYLTVEKLEKENAKRVNKLSTLKEPVEFLVNSVHHKRTLFKNVLKFPSVKSTKKGAYATDKECFAVWSAKYPEVRELEVIKKIEELSKMLGTYVLPLLNKNVDGRIHCSYRVTGAATGRISSASPNLQNISQHSEEAKKLKKCFIAKSGHSIVACDLSNAELRVTAAISKDPVMIESFKSGFDPHSSTAKAVFNLDCEVHEIKEKYNDFRQKAKTLNFAALYGSSAKSIADNLKISEEAANAMLKEYFTKHRGVAQLFKDNEAAARKYGFIVYPSGRRRRVPGATVSRQDHDGTKDSKAVSIYNKAIRQVNNSIIQGSSSDIALEALANMWDEIDEKGLNYQLINIIHDSIEMEVPDSEVTDAVQFITRHMGIWGKYLDAPFPMKCDAEVGKTWADLHEPEEPIFGDEEEDEEFQEAA